MTLRDMVDAGIEIQGNIIIRIWNEATFDYDVNMYIDADDYAAFGFVAFLEGNEDLLDKEIKYVFAIMDYDKANVKTAFTVYELVEE